MTDQSQSMSTLLTLCISGNQYTPHVGDTAHNPTVENIIIYLQPAPPIVLWNDECVGVLYCTYNFVKFQRAWCFKRQTT